MNIWDWIIIAILAAVIALALRRVIRNRRQGGCSCGADCGCGRGEQCTCQKKPAR